MPREFTPRSLRAQSAERAQLPSARPKPKRRFPAEVLTDAEVRALMEACGRYAPVAARNRALLAFTAAYVGRLVEAVFEAHAPSFGREGRRPTLTDREHAGP